MCSRAAASSSLNMAIGGCRKNERCGETARASDRDGERRGELKSNSKHNNKQQQGGGEVRCSMTFGPPT